MKFYVETYGCQMNVYDSWQLGLLLETVGHEPVDSLDEAEIILLNTCAVRESAEQRVWGQLGHRKRLKEEGAVEFWGFAAVWPRIMARPYLSERLMWIWSRAPAPWLPCRT